MSGSRLHHLLNGSGGEPRPQPRGLARLDLALHAGLVAVLLWLVYLAGWSVPARLAETRRDAETLLREFRQERDAVDERTGRLRTNYSEILRNMARIRVLQEDFLNGKEE